MRKIICFIVFLCICLFMLSSSTIFAGVLGGKWATNPTYYISSSNPYYSSITSAVNSWNNALAFIFSNIRIRNTSPTSATINITTAYYGNTGWNAAASTYPNMHSGTYTSGQIRLNRSYMDSYTEGKRELFVHMSSDIF